MISIVIAACATHGAAVQRPVDIEIVNRSGREIDNCEVQFGENVCKWGVVGKGARKAYLSYPHPISVVAELRWEVDGQKIVRRLSLEKTYPRDKAGRLSFIVTDSSAEVEFRAQK